MKNLGLHSVEYILLFKANRGCNCSLFSSPLGGVVNLKVKFLQKSVLPLEITSIKKERHEDLDLK